MACKIIGCGSYLPQKVLTNADLQLTIDTTDEWIRTRTGIVQRHIAAENEYSSHLAFFAAKSALQNAKISESEIDLVIVATTTPDNSFPSTATKLQNLLSLGNVPSFDLQAVCSGFIYALQIASSLVETKKYRTILLVSAEKMSSLLDWDDRRTCVLFGDGAGAVILQYSDTVQKDIGVIDSILYSDGSYYDLLYTDGGVSSTMNSGKIKMNGTVLFKHAVEKMISSIIEILKRNNLSINDIDHLVPHQANLRIIEAIAARLKLPEHKLVITIAEHANCSAASIPLALAAMQEAKRLKSGDLVLCTAFGAGFTWGAALIRW